MIEPLKKFDALFETFDKSGISDFRRFLNKNSDVRKWFISADFCLHDKERPNNVFAFSIIPCDKEFDEIKLEITNAIPKDWKKTKIISRDSIDLLSDERIFHIAFVLPKSPKVFGNGPGSDSISVARESVSITVRQLIEKGCSGESLRRLQALKRETSSGSFNVRLLSDLYLLNDLFCFVTLLLAREREIEVVGWLPDRDNMTTWCGGVVFNLGVEHLMGLAEYYGITVPPGGPCIALPTPAGDNSVTEQESERSAIESPTREAKSSGMWFDELVRLPDYVAGILAAWDFKANEIPGEKDKYRVMAQDFAAFAMNVMVFKIRYDESFQSSRITFRREASGSSGSELTTQ